MPSIFLDVNPSIEIQIDENDNVLKCSANNEDAHKLLEDISFNAGGDHPMIEVVIDKKYVDEHLEAVVRSQNLKKYIL